jgi:hypothetical protein
MTINCHMPTAACGLFMKLRGRQKSAQSTKTQESKKKSPVFLN